MGIFNSDTKKLLNYQNELIETHFEEVKNMYDKMRTWRHDFKNHIQALKILAAQADIEGIENYLSRLEEDLRSMELKVKTGNRMADAIINSKISLADAKGIKTSVDANIPIELRIADVDLCVIIGNLFDNAIEASLKLDPKERMIRVYMDMKGEQLYISFTNLTAFKKRKILNTDKGQDHGLGLKSIDRIVESYGGYIARNNEDGAFTTEILLSQK